MRILALNTASSACDLALAEDGLITGCLREDMARGQDARLADAVRELLASGGLVPGDLDRLAVVCGPGSFTGVRIGVAFARALALTLGIDCVGVTSLEAASPCERTSPHRVALIARKRPPDISFWTQDICGLETLGPAQERPIEEVSGDLPLLSDRPDLLAGAQPCSPSAATTALRARHLSPETSPARPVYVREPDAALPASKQ